MKPSRLPVPVVLALASLLFLIAATPKRAAKSTHDYNAATPKNAFPAVTKGVNVSIKSAAIAKDGTITARFTVTDSKGRGLDVDGIQTPGTLTLRFVAAYIPAGKTQYTAYTTSVLNSITNKNPSQTVAGTDTGGKFSLVDATTGTYDYTFGTKAPATFDPAVTHSIGMQAERDLSDFGVDGVASADDVFTFVPNGSPVVTVRDIVNEATCNGCHDPLGAHGGARKKIAYCVLCHQPQSVNPDTQNTADFPVFIHKLHMGSSLPSVKAGNPYFMIHRGAKVDFSDIVFPQDIRNCTACHSASPKQGNNWKTNPSRAACGSCHETVNFATGEGHVNLPQVSDNQCKTCHTPDATGEFDASVPGAHTVPNNSAALPGIVLEIQKIENATPNSSPVVTFKVTDKKGNPVDISKLTTIRVVLAGPNEDYQAGDAGVRNSENPATTPGTNGVYTYTMTGKLPAAAKGSYTISMEARNTVTLMAGTVKQMTATDSAKSVQSYFTVDKTPVYGRRVVVATEKCAACHQNLAFVHGGSRTVTQECVLCHNPTLTDNSGQAVSFATQIHAIHRGENLENSYIIGGNNYQDVRFPGDLRDCKTCHVNNSYLVENVGAKAAIASPGRFTPTMQPISAACQGCHDGKVTASHALANTSAIGESCATCHGASAEFSVDKVHARP